MRLSFRILTAAAVLCLPTLAHAQRQEGMPVGNGDIERLNPARVLLDRKKELRLDTRQLSSLDSLRQAFDREGKRLADSVRRYQRAITTPPPMLRRPPEGKPETKKDSVSRAKLDSTNRMKRDTYFAQVTTGRRDLAATLLTMKELFDTSVEKATGILSGDQRTSGTMSLEAASEAFTRRLRLANIR